MTIAEQLFAKGYQIGFQEAAKQMLEYGLPPEKIAEITELPLGQTNMCKADSNH